MKKKAIIYLLFTFLTFVFLLFPQKSISASIEDTIIFCGKSVIPQLFFHICLSSIVWELGIVEYIVASFPKYGPEISAFSMGILSGFPSGAIIAGKLYENHIITRKRAEYLSTFSNNAGISFVFGYVATVVGKKGAFSIFLCQIIFSVLYAFFWRIFLSSEDKDTFAVPNPKTPSLLSTVRGVRSATETIINICGFILFFSVFSKSLLATAPIFLRGLMELTVGISLLSPLPFHLRLWYCALFSGFGGLCVHFQVFSANDSGIKKFILSKCFSALLFPPITLLIHDGLSLFSP
jgi:hypothetical protein